MLLNEAQIEQFKRFGYVLLPSFLSASEVAATMTEVDRYVAKEPPFDGRNVWQYDRLCELIVHGPTLAIVDQLTHGDGFTFHHMHSAVHPPGMPGIGWHHDYEQVPQTNRQHVQVHVLHYLNGLDGTIGDFLLLPKSHRSIMRRDALWFFGHDELPGAVVIDNIPRGSTLICHSALVHARRPKPGGTSGQRYFLDISYMQRGVRWPSYGRERWQDMLSELDSRWHQPDRPQLFASNNFFDIADAVSRIDGVSGSLAMHLPEADASKRPLSGRIPII